jgi:hypothetical protein
MAENLSYQLARSTLATMLNERLNKTYKELVETKHLYQSVIIDFESPFTEVRAKVVGPNDKEMFGKYVTTARHLSLFLAEEQRYSTDPNFGWNYPSLGLLLGNVKLFCSACKALETFSPASYTDVTNDIRGTNTRIVSYPPDLQVFAISYQCETCKKLPVAFLIRRAGWKLTIEGRSPFETVVPPPFLPKIETWLFSGAIVAQQTGNTLAGLFYLRSFIEQFARRQTGIKGKKNGDTILVAYQKLIPKKQRDQMPSLRSWYEKLSVPIHKAKEDIAVFEEAKASIIEHFDFRRAFKIEDAAPPLESVAGG